MEGTYASSLRSVPTVVTVLPWAPGTSNSSASGLSTATPTTVAPAWGRGMVNPVSPSAANNFTANSSSASKLPGLSVIIV